MCGICGYVNIDGRPVTDNHVIEIMTESLFHRGPDDHGFFVKDNVALGHRRLSIIDIEGGHQPISDDKSSLSIVYNGEIYNFPELKEELIKAGHRFFTRSDTEVVIKAYAKWRERCLDRFNGMFAFAVWDSEERSLFLARDRFGKKPLYYGTFGNAFIFGSELKALYKHPSVTIGLDRLALAKYMAHDYIPSPNTIIEGIHKLEAGHYLIFRRGKTIKRKYWDFEFDPDRFRKADISSSKDMFLDILRDSVRRRLISDVPLGVFLSGGIDSSAIVAMMSELMDPKDIKTFAIGFNDKSYNEADSALLVAGRFGTDHKEKYLTGGMMLDLLPSVLDTIDEPFADSSIIPTYMLSRFTREHVKVALGGDGGDELFMGYPSFIAHRIASFYELFPPFIKRAIKGFADFMPETSNYMSLKFKIDRFMKGMTYPVSVRHQAWIGSFPPHEQRSLFVDSKDQSLFSPENIYSESISHFNACANLPVLDRVEYLYIKTYMTDDILAKVDRASMAVSLEVRAPFLDKSMADFSGSLPNAFKLKYFTTKYLIKEAFKGILPRAILRKPKHGFAVPVGGWFRKELRPLFEKMFAREAIADDGMLNYEYVKKLFDDHCAGRIDNGRKLWALFIFQMWYNKWIKKGRAYKI